MKENSTNKSSPTQIQSSMFIGNLRAEMDKMSKNCKQKEMVKMAHDYIRTGMSRKETEELLQLDGFDPIIVQALMKTANFDDEFKEDNAPRWEFSVEDTRGRIFSSSDFGIIISAASEQEAMEKAEIEILKNSTLELDNITNIYRV